MLKNSRTTTELPLGNHCHFKQQSVTTKYGNWRTAFGNSSRTHSVCDCGATEMPPGSWQRDPCLRRSDIEVYVLLASKGLQSFQCECPDLLSQRTAERAQ